MNYSHFKDAKGNWWWRVEAPDGSIIQDSGSGYVSEHECLEALDRIQGSNHREVTQHLSVRPSVTTPTPRPKAPEFEVKNTEPAKAEPTNEHKEAPTQTPTTNAAKAWIVDVTLGESPIASVFTTKDKQLRWRYKDNDGVVPFRLVGAVLEFDSIMATIAVSVPKPYQKETYHHLGKALFAAFHTPDGTKPTSSFRAVRVFVRKKAKERARLAYVLASVAATILLGLVVIPVYCMATESSAVIVALGGWFGSVGAIISVLQRNASLEIDPWMSNRYLAIQGIARIVLGLIFGGVFVLACKANLILGLVRDNPHQLLVLCIVAGFSERVIPELLSKLESGQLHTAKVEVAAPDRQST